MSDDDWGDEVEQETSSPAYELAEVVDDYIPENNDTLTLIKYDLVYVFKKNPDGWWEGESKGVYGKFPSFHVKIIKDSGNSMADPNWAQKQEVFNRTAK